MKLKLGQLVDAQDALTDLASKQLVARSAFQVRLVLSAVREPLKAYRAALEELVKKHGTQLPDGSWRVVPKNIAAFSAELEPLREQEIELQITPLPFSAIEDARISGGYLLALDWLIKEDAK